MLMAGGWFATSMAEQLLPFIAAPHAMIGGLEAGAGVEIGAQALWAVAPFLGAVMLATILGGVGGNLAQPGLMFTAEKLKPDWSKVNPHARASSASSAPTAWSSSSRPCSSCSPSA